jgi:hypothetical protein
MHISAGSSRVDLPIPLCVCVCLGFRFSIWANKSLGFGSRIQGLEFRNTGFRLNTGSTVSNEVTRCLTASDTDRIFLYIMCSLQIPV